MNEQGKVIALFVSGHKVDSMELDYDGIIGDKHYAKDPNRSILISSLKSYSMAKDNAIHIDHGFLGENILIDLNPYNLSAGDKISIGDLMLEITQNCTICNSLGKADKKLPDILRNDRGIFAKCIQNATIKNNDLVKIIAT